MCEGNSSSRADSFFDLPICTHLRPLDGSLLPTEPKPGTRGSITGFKLKGLCHHS